MSTKKLKRYEKEYEEEKNERNEENGNKNQNKIWNNNSKCNLHAATNHDGQKYGRRNDFSVNSVCVCVYAVLNTKFM